MLITGQATAGTAPSVLCTVPAGPCTVLISNAGTASPVWIGAGTAVTAGNGFPVPSGAVSPVTFPGYPASPATPLSVVCSSGSASVGFLISSASGGTGL